MGGAAATIAESRAVQGHHQAYELGEGVNGYDVNGFGLSLAGRAALLYLRAGGWPADSCSHSAISGFF